MPNVNVDIENKTITIDFTEVEYKALSWIDKNPFDGIVDRINRKVDYAITEAVRWEMDERLKDPSITTMPASRDELIMGSSRPPLSEQVDAIDANGSNLSPGERKYT
jgi:hypothetical protein